MTDKFLKAKQWQIFFLSWGIPLILQFITISSLISGNESEVIVKVMTLFPLMMIVSTGTIFGWLWSIAVGLQNKIPENIKMKVTKFKILFFIPLVYMSFLLASISFSMNGMSSSGQPTEGFIE